VHLADTWSARDTCGRSWSANAAGIIAAIRQLTSVTRLAFLPAACFHQHVPQLAAAVAALPCLCSLNLDGIFHPSPAIRQQYLTDLRFDGQMLCTLEHWELRENDCWHTIVRALPPGVPDEALIYDGGDGPESDLARFMRHVNTAPQAEWLWLYNLTARDNVLSTLLPYFAGLRAIHTFYLNFSELSLRIALSLGAALVQLSALEELMLCWVSVEKGSVAPLFPGIAALTGLLESTVQGCCLAGEVQLFEREYMPHMQSLQEGSLVSVEEALRDGAQPVASSCWWRL
jgi:hypothetical protein